MTEPFHTLVVGAGSGGLTVAVGLSRLGRRVALVERDRIGGDCTNVGCVPSKTLIHLTADPAHRGLAPAEVLARVRARRDALHDEERAWIEGMANVTLVRGSARLLPPQATPQRVAVALAGGGETTLEADRVVIATGSRPIVPEIPGLPACRTLTNESLFDLADVPDHLVVVGAGIIGCEMAFAFRRLGVRVTLVDLAPRVLGTLEPEVSELLEARLREVGVELWLEAAAERFEADTRTLVLAQRGETRRLAGVDRVLLAVGRRPNLEGLGLEALGVPFTAQGVPTNAWGGSGVGGVYVIGDANARSAFTHSANEQGRRLVRRLLLPWLPLGPEPEWPAAVFTDPEVAQVGPSRALLEQRWHPELIHTRRVDLADTDRGYTMGLERGFLLLHALRFSGRLLSATLVAPAASEMVGLLTLAVNRGTSLYRLSALVHPYPTLSQALRTAADGFVFHTLPRLPRELGAFARLRWRSPPGPPPERS